MKIMNSRSTNKVIKTRLKITGKWERSVLKQARRWFLRLGSTQSTCLPYTLCYCRKKLKDGIQVFRRQILLEDWVLPDQVHRKIRRVTPSNGVKWEWNWSRNCRLSASQPPCLRKYWSLIKLVCPAPVFVATGFQRQWTTWKLIKARKCHQRQICRPGIITAVHKNVHVLFLQ